MTTKSFAAVAAMLVLAGCRQAEDQPNTAAANDAAAAAPAGNSAIAATAPVSRERARQLFHERHEGMEDIGKATKAISRQLKSDSPDLAAVREAAATINRLAPKSESWFPAGTGKDVVSRTRALPAIWDKPDDFVARDRDFQRAAQAFNGAAGGDDVQAIRSHFATLGKTCKACHDTYRAEEHPK